MTVSSASNSLNGSNGEAGGILRCAIVEDEPEARANLIAYLSEAPRLEVVGAAANGHEALALVDAARPDLLLLDIRLPEMSGLEVLRRLFHRPEIVFTTAHESYALEAFELGALDYLVKPFGRERLLAAIERVRGRLGMDRGGPGSIERALVTESRPLTRLFARKGNRIVPIAVDEITYIRATADYSEIHAGPDSFLVQITLRELLQCLDPLKFEQLHRSFIVNLSTIDHMRPADDRRLLVTLKDGTALVASRAASERIRRLVR